MRTIIIELTDEEERRIRQLELRGFVAGSSQRILMEAMLRGLANASLAEVQHGQNTNLEDIASFGRPPVTGVSRFDGGSQELVWDAASGAWKDRPCSLSPRFYATSRRSRRYPGMTYERIDGANRVTFRNGLQLTWYDGRRYSCACAWWWGGRMLWVGEAGRC